MKSDLKFRSIAYVFLGLGVGLFLALAPNKAFACTNPGSIPSGFTNPCPVFDAEPTSVQSSGSVTLTVTPSTAKQFISQSVYLYNGTNWQALSLVGAFKSGYASSTATYIINSAALSQLPSGNIYLAEWDWTWNPTLECFVGPSSTACNQGNWRLQEFSLSGGGGQGSCSYNGSSQPFKYVCARTDLCEGATSTNPDGTPCNGAPGQPNSPLSFMGENETSPDGSYVPLQSAPNVGGLIGAGNCINDPDFGSKICRLTDYSDAIAGLSWSMSDTGGNNWWSIDDTKFLADSSGGGGIYLFSFSGNSNMTSTLSGIGGSTTHGSATSFATNHIAFSTIYPNVLYELDYGTKVGGVPFVQINKLILNDSGAPSTWTLTRTKLFNFVTDSAHCLPTNFFPTWAGSFQISDDDLSFQVGLGDHGQNGKRDATHPYGATLIANYTVGEGCRVLDTYGNASDAGPGQIYGLNGTQPPVQPPSPYAGMTIWGDWGAVGQATNGTGTLALGVSGGAPLPDTQYIHDTSADDDPLYSSVSGSTDTTTTPQNVACWGMTTTGLCESYTWEVATTNIRPDRPEGHGAFGYVYQYKGHSGATFNFEDPWNPVGDLLNVTIPVDNHGSYNNVDTADDQPVLFFSTNVCDQAAGNVGSTPCAPEYTGPLYDEVIGVENAAAHPSAGWEDCNYGSGDDPAGCVYRFAHTFNTGTNWNFDGQNAIGTVSPNGRFAIFPSDWNLQLGCTNGTTNCLDSVQGSLSTTCTAGGLASLACQREDLFVVSLQ